MIKRCNNVVSTLFQRRSPTLSQRCAMLLIGCRILFHFQRQINVISTLIHNVETTLIRRWNVGWDYSTEKRWSTVSLSGKDIGKIIQNLDSNKVHGHDKYMIKICSDSIYKALGIMFWDSNYLPIDSRSEEMIFWCRV